MSLVRIVNPNELRPAHAVMLALVLVALAGNCLLTSAGKPQVLPDGAVDWKPDSLLLAVVELLDLQYAQPTPNGTDVKALVHGIATALGLIVAVVGLVARSRTAEAADGDTVIDVEQYAAGGPREVPLVKRQLDAIRTAQVLMLLYVGWSFASQWWSAAPAFARAGSILLALQVGWAYAVGFGLNRRAARLAALLLVGVLGVTGALAIAYHGVRNPTLRASYPIGNALFLAACLIPGILMGFVALANGAAEAVRRRSWRHAVAALVCLAAVVVMLGAFHRTHSRGPQLALMVGAGALIFFSVGKRARIAVALVAVVLLAIAGANYWGQRSAGSATGRDVSMRARLYAWSYALDLFGNRPVLGHGQGGYALLADDLATADVENDPAALEYRLVHAHNEWLEVGSDLGSVGVVLVLGALALTLYGGARALPRVASRSSRLTLLAMLAALVGLIVDECFSVGLRVEGLPLVFYTVVGLIWALAGPEPTGVVAALSRRRALGVAAVVASAGAGLVLAEFARRDFVGARAQYDAEAALVAGDWAAAAPAADRAGELRLPPQRRLGALHQQVRACQLAAGALQEQYVRRRQALESGGVAHPALGVQAQQSRAESEAYLAAGFAALTELRHASPSEIDTGGLEYNLRLVYALYAELDGNAEEAEGQRLAAADALRRQLTRAPFEPEVAVWYVRAAGPALDENAALEALARPLRIHTVPASYVDLLASLAPSEMYARDIAPLIAAAAETDPATPPAAWPDRWAPEKLRIGAVSRLARDEYDAAASALARAAELYDVIAAEAPLARASCRAELAEARFIQQPEDPALAIAEAQRALEFAPQSEMGRALCDAVAVRLIDYHLAAGYEDFARTIVQQRIAQVAPAELDAVIAAAYVRMAYRVFPQAAVRAPVKLADWCARAVALAPEMAAAWFLDADVAIHDGDTLELERALGEIERLQADPQSVADLLRRAVEAMPNHDALRRRLDEYERNLPPDPPGP